MKKLTAILLMVCLLLTLASCGKKDEADAGVKARTFEGEMEWATIKATGRWHLPPGGIGVLG